MPGKASPYINRNYENKQSHTQMVEDIACRDMLSIAVLYPG